jgi:transcriptional regulator with XRE-family HTH domain
MPLLREIGTAVRQRRREIGLSQQQLAQLAELSRATVNDLETGRLKDLSSRRIERLANELGFAVGVVGTRKGKSERPLQVAARIASVPYGRELPGPVLEDTLRKGVVPPAYIPQVRTLLQEAPVAVLADVAAELEEHHDIPARDTWGHMRALARALDCDRPLWQGV